MSIVEATSLLAACKPLCSKVAGSVMEVNWELEKEDLPPLWGFYKVTKAGLAYNDQVRRAAGLERRDISILNYLLACQL